MTLADAGRHRDLAAARCPASRSTLADDGEIIVAGPSVAGGAHATGDLGAARRRGRLIVLGRKVDTIVSGGENVMPAGGRGRPARPPGRRARRACSAARTRSGARPSPPSSSARDVDPAELRDSRRAARPLQGPEAIEIVDALPRNAAGKLLRRELS